MRCKITNQNMEALTLPAPLTGALAPLGIAIVALTVDEVTALFGGAAGVLAARIALDEAPATAELTSQGDGAGAVSGTQLANVDNAATVVGVPGLIRINVADATGDTDVVMEHKVRVLDAWFRNSGIAAHAATDTVQLKNGADAITDAIAKTATVNAVKRAATINPTYEEIAAGGTMRVAATKTTNVAGTMYVLAVRVE